MQIKPVGDKVLVIPDSADNVTESGLFVRSFDADIQQRGTVSAVGERVRAVRPGDRIVYERFAGSPVSVSGADYLIMGSADIIAVIDGM